MYSYSYLAHYGILGMKWGVRRYQNYDGSLTAEGRKHVGIKSDSPRHKPSNARKAAREKAKNLEKARKAKEEKKAYEEKKEEVLKKGTASEILKYKGDLTSKQMKDALERIDYEKRLSDIAAKETKTIWDKIDSFAKKTEKITNVANKGIDFYNVIAKVHNSIVDEEDRWPDIDGKPKAKKSNHNIDKLVKTGTAKEILKKADNLSTEQLQDVVKRINAKDTLKKQADNEERKKRNKSRK